MSKNRSLRIVITGGGTGGHTIPAGATIEALQEIASEHGLDLNIAYIGSKTGVEKRSADELGIPFYSIETGKLRRSANPLRMLNIVNVRDMLRVPEAVSYTHLRAHETGRNLVCRL